MCQATKEPHLNIKPMMELQREKIAQVNFSSQVHQPQRWIGNYINELSEPQTAPFDMIIETDLLIAMEMDLKSSNQIKVWGKLTAPRHLDKTKMKMTSHMTWHPKHQS